MNALLALSLTLGVQQPAEGLLLEAERHFSQGVADRGDAAKARPHFAEAAAAFDRLWESGVRNPALALNRARAHRLAGNLPACIAALHDGLAVARYDRSLQVELEDSRDAVEYPHADLAEACRPLPQRGIATRMSPFEAFLLAGVLWLAVCLAAARYSMTRVPGWLLIGSTCLITLIALGAVWWLDSRHQEQSDSQPLVIIRSTTPLREGNGDSWPERLKWKLPAGAEARERLRRGRWIQIELASGTSGWIPESAAIVIEP